MKWFALLALAATFTSQANTQMCFTRAGNDYGIDPLLLAAISIQESSLKPRAVNNSYSATQEDVCGMQVNSSHYEELKKFNITRERLLNEPCICTYAGAWVLAKNFRSYGKNWDSVGIYNAGPRKKMMAVRKSYARTISGIYKVLLVRKKMTQDYLISMNISTANNPLLSAESIASEAIKYPVR